MIVYVLPGSGIFGGVKAAFQFVDLLRDHGLGVVLATPGGEAPQWFASSAPVVARESILDRLGRDDRVIFSLPHDHAELRSTGAKLVFHCQGTDPMIAPIIGDPDVTVLTCWRQAARHVAEVTGRISIDVGISVSDVFFGSHSPRRPRTVAHMPRRGPTGAIAEMRDVVHVPIDGDHESKVAEAMGSSRVFAAIAENEWFGLPALEAMAAGCAVVSVPTIGGEEYLHDGRNCVIVDPDGVAPAVQSLLDDDERREFLRRNAVITAQRFRRAIHAGIVADALAGELGTVLR